MRQAWKIGVRALLIGSLLLPAAGCACMKPPPPVPAPPPPPPPPPPPNDGTGKGLGSGQHSENAITAKLHFTVA